MPFFIYFFSAAYGWNLRSSDSRMMIVPDDAALGATKKSCGTHKTKQECSNGLESNCEWNDERNKCATKPGADGCPYEKMRQRLVRGSLTKLCRQVNSASEDWISSCCAKDLCGNFPTVKERFREKILQDGKFTKDGPNSFVRTGEDRTDHLGKGNFGEVVQVTNCKSDLGLIVAKMPKSIRNNTWDIIWNDAVVHQKLNGPPYHVPRLFYIGSKTVSAYMDKNGGGFPTDVTVPYPVMEQLGKDFEHVIPDGGLSKYTTYYLLLKLVEGLQYIVAKGYVHGDLKPANLLRGNGEKNSELKIIDFGLSGEFAKSKCAPHLQTELDFGSKRHFTDDRCHWPGDDVESLLYTAVYFAGGPQTLYQFSNKQKYKRTGRTTESMCAGKIKEFCVEWKERARSLQDTSTTSTAEKMTDYTDFFDRMKEAIREKMELEQSKTDEEVGKELDDGQIAQMNSGNMVDSGGYSIW